MARTIWESNKKQPIANGFFAWDAIDEEYLKEGAALKRAFHTTTVRGTPRRKAKLAGGPKNRERRKTLVASN